MKNHRRAVIAAAVLWAAGLVPASAEPVTITSGFVTVTGSSSFSPVQLQGTDGVSPFAFIGGMFSDSVIAVRQCSINPCDLTQTSLSLAINSSGGDMPGTVTYGQDSYGVGTSQSDSVGSMNFLVSGFVLLPPPPTAADLMATVTGAFQLDQGSGFRAPSVGGPFQHSGGSLSGGGLATVTFGTELVHDVPHWVFRSAEYQFANPTPEPASLWLLASGLAGIVLHRRQKSNRRSRTESAA